MKIRFYLMMTDPNNVWGPYRGGCWFIDSPYSQVRNRLCWDPDDKGSNIGFRMVLLADRP